MLGKHVVWTPPEVPAKRRVPNTAQDVHYCVWSPEEGGDAEIPLKLVKTIASPFYPRKGGDPLKATISDTQIKITEVLMRSVNIIWLILNGFYMISLFIAEIRSEDILYLS